MLMISGLYVGYVVPLEAPCDLLWLLLSGWWRSPSESQLLEILQSAGKDGEG